MRERALMKTFCPAAFARCPLFAHLHARYRFRDACARADYFFATHDAYASYGFFMPYEATS